MAGPSSFPTGPLGWLAAQSNQTGSLRRKTAKKTHILIQPDDRWDGLPKEMVDIGWSILRQQSYLAQPTDAPFIESLNHAKQHWLHNTPADIKQGLKIKQKAESTWSDDDRDFLMYLNKSS